LKISRVGSVIWYGFIESIYANCYDTHWWWE